ncbi:MAG TPA: substrate-binding domain-containing protein, partial [Acidimicrobiales bacterium]|nr:substrate-binding domain-containing protein [Acidimicrobiales bacterium]
MTNFMGRQGKRRVVLAGMAVALGAAACGSSSPSSSGTTTSQGNTTTTQAVACATGSISGAGSTFVQNLAQQWIKDYGTRCPGATINYQGVGSGAGITQFTAGTVDFGATDVPLSADQKTALTPKGATVQIPWASGGIALEYNLSGVDKLQLSANTIAGIFAGTIKTW